MTGLEGIERPLTESEPVSEEESATNCELGCRGQLSSRETQRVVYVCFCCDRLASLQLNQAGSEGGESRYVLTLAASERAGRPSA
jgi:hypothetical protein